MTATTGSPENTSTYSVSATEDMTGIFGIILCGGQSRRMGCPKGDLLFGDETVLQRIVRMLTSVIPEVIVVGAPESPRPALPQRVRYVRDVTPGLGPLSGLASGLSVLPTGACSAYLCGCDTPLLRTEFVQFLCSRLHSDASVAVVEHEGLLQPLAAVYRRDLLEQVQRMLKDGERSLQALLRSTSVRRIRADELRNVDPALDSLRGMNTPEEYQALLSRWRKQQEEDAYNRTSQA